MTNDTSSSPAEISANLSRWKPLRIWPARGLIGLMVLFRLLPRLIGDSSLLGFRVDVESGRLELIGHTPCPQVPRGFVIDHAGEYLWVAGQVAAKLASFRINQASGELEPIKVLDTLPSPNWVRCVHRPTPEKED